MSTDPAEVDIEFTFRHVDSAAAVKEYALKRLGKTIRSLPNLRTASVEITFENTRPVEDRNVVQVTLAVKRTVLRVEDAGPDVRTAIDSVHDRLERRVRDWKGRVYFTRRQKAASHKQTVQMEATRLPPEDKTGLIERVKSYETKPMFPEDAVEQMELLGHDFFLFLNGESGRHNVVYRRKAGGGTA